MLDRVLGNPLWLNQSLAWEVEHVIGTQQADVLRGNALDNVLELEAGATKQQLLDAMSGHVLGEGQLIGVYER